MMSDVRLALDVGTRTVVALAYVPRSDGTVEVVGLEAAEHAGRPMRDGTVEDVEAVAAAVREVVGRLARRGGAVAAVAGRALRVARASARRRYDPPRGIERADEAALAAAAGAAAARGREAGGLAEAHVGTVVVGRWADGTPVGRLAGRVAAEAEVEVVATFLPAAAVESKARALAAAGVDLDGLLLEPIAVLGALAPTGTPSGDVALVDVGAGTTDVAVARADGSADFRAIGIAGDEATEAVGALLGVEFMVAERAKRAAAAGEAVRARDSLGRTRDVPPAEIAAVLAEEAERLAGAVAAQIRAVSARVRAVACVGGGSLLPGFPARLAAALGLPAEAVALRPAETVEGIEDTTGRLAGPHLTTVAAIARSAPAALRPGVWEVEASGVPGPASAAEGRRRVFALASPEGRTAAEILHAAGYRPEAWEGSAGASVGVVVRVEGAERLEVFAGTPGGAPRIEVLEGAGPAPSAPAPAGLEDLVPPGRTIRLLPGTTGRAADATVRAALETAGLAAVRPTVGFVVNGRRIEVPEGRPARRSGRPADLDERLAEGDVVEAAAARPTRRLAEVVAAAAERPARGARLEVRLDGRPAPLDAEAGEGAVVEMRWGD